MLFWQCVELQPRSWECVDQPSCADKFNPASLFRNRKLLFSRLETETYSIKRNSLEQRKDKKQKKNIIYKTSNVNIELHTSKAKFSIDTGQNVSEKYIKKHLRCGFPQQISNTSGLKGFKCIMNMSHFNRIWDTSHSIVRYLLIWT